jgi:hypothetical protein
MNTSLPVNAKLGWLWRVIFFISSYWSASWVWYISLHSPSTFLLLGASKIKLKKVNKKRTVTVSG